MLWTVVRTILYLTVHMSEHQQKQMNHFWQNYLIVNLTQKKTLKDFKVPMFL